METSTIGSKVSDIMKSNKSINISSGCMRACNNHIIVNYIPMNDELTNIRRGHRVHLFIHDINFMKIAVLLTDFISNVYDITKKRIIIHVPRSKTMLLGILTDICRLYNHDGNHMYRIEPMTKSFEFLYQDTSIHISNYTRTIGGSYVIIEYSTKLNVWIIRRATSAL